MFGSLENLSLELSYSNEPINAEAWIDPEVVALAGITLIQTRKTKPIPVIMAGSEFWAGFIDWVREALHADRLVSDADVSRQISSGSSSTNSRVVESAS